MTQYLIVPVLVLSWVALSAAPALADTDWQARRAANDAEEACQSSDAHVAQLQGLVAQLLAEVRELKAIVAKDPMVAAQRKKAAEEQAKADAARKAYEATPTYQAELKAKKLAAAKAEKERAIQEGRPAGDMKKRALEK